MIMTEEDTKEAIAYQELMNSRIAQINEFLGQFKGERAILRPKVLIVPNEWRRMMMNDYQQIKKRLLTGKEWMVAFTKGEKVQLFCSCECAAFLPSILTGDK